MDLVTLIPAETCKIEFKHPSSGKPTGLSMIINGKDSKKFEASTHKIKNEVSARKDTKPLTSEELDDVKLGLIVDCISGWEGDWVFQGKKLEFSKENVKLALSKVKWMREQVDIEMGNRDNFFGKQPKI